MRKSRTESRSTATSLGESKRIYAISGLFLTRPVTGMERYAIEVTRRLDLQLDPECETAYLVVPPNTQHDFQLQNIEVVEVGHRLRGNLGGYLWEQLWFTQFLRKRDAQGYLPLNFVPASRPDVVVTIHDGNALSHPEFYPTVKKRLYRQLASTLIRVARRRTRRVLTVSQSSRDELVELCGFDPRFVDVAAPGLEHLPSAPGQTVRTDLPSEFYFALSSATYNKNFEWVLEAAANNPHAEFVIAGAGDFRAVLESRGSSAPLTNIRHLGYVTDDERNVLYATCTAFIFPSRYEGFGLPPLEAACLGAPVIVSDIPPMREIFGHDFRYVDPDKPAVDLQAVTNTPNIDDLRARYSWTDTAAKVLAHLRLTANTECNPAGSGGMPKK